MYGYSGWLQWSLRVLRNVTQKDATKELGRARACVCVCPSQLEIGSAHSSYMHKKEVEKAVKRALVF